MLAKVYKHLTFAYFRDTATQETGPKFFTNWNHFSVSLFYFDNYRKPIPSLDCTLIKSVKNISNLNQSKSTKGKLKKE